MPKYNYICSGCGEEFEIYHSMFEIIDECIMCESRNVQRIPSLSFTSRVKSESGHLVKDFIEEARREVQAEKSKLKEDYDG